MKPGAKRNNHYQPKYPTEYTLPDNIYTASFYAARHTFKCLLEYENNGMNRSLNLNQSFGKKGNLTDLRYLTVYMLRYILQDMDDIIDRPLNPKYEDPVSRKDMTATLAVNHASANVLRKACNDAFLATGLDGAEIPKMKDHICGKQYRDFSEYEEYKFRKAWPICIFQAAKNLGYILEDENRQYILSVEPFVIACTESLDALPEGLSEMIQYFVMTCEIDAETGQLFFSDENMKENLCISSYTKIFLWNVAVRLGFI